jgi:hypothetical protein
VGVFTSRGFFAGLIVATTYCAPVVARSLHSWSRRSAAT